MQIDKVKDLGNIFLVNDCFSVPKNAGNSHYLSIQKWIENGGTIEPEFSLEERKQNLKQKLISNRKKYLSSTDWYILREADEPDSYPEEIKNKRILARQEINQIEAATTLTALNQFDEVFE